MSPSSPTCSLGCPWQDQAEEEPSLQVWDRRRRARERRRRKRGDLGGGWRRQRCKKRRRKLERTAKSEGKEGKRGRKRLRTTLRRVAWWAEGRGARATSVNVCSECCVTHEPAPFHRPLSLTRQSRGCTVATDEPPKVYLEHTVREALMHQIWRMTFNTKDDSISF